jgi:hypothetical protein
VVTLTQSAQPVSLAQSIGPSSRSDRPEHERLFARDGYVVIRDVVSREKLTSLHAKILDEYHRVRSSGLMFSAGGNLTGHLNCFPGAEARFAYDDLEQHGVIDFIRSVYKLPFGGCDVGCNLNLPNSIIQHYHTDSTFVEHFMTVNVAMVDTDVVNGAIEVAAGTHRSFHPFWRFALEKGKQLRRQLPMKQGDVLVRTSTLWHRGMPNRSSIPRPMLAFNFGEKRGRPTDPFQFNDGKIMFYENWFRTNWLGQLRERTFIAAPFTYDTVRFVRSLFTHKGYAE